MYTIMFLCVVFLVVFFFSLKHDLSQTQNLKVAENIEYLSLSSLISHQTLTPSTTMSH